LAMERKVFSLLQVAQSIQKTISDRYTSTYWIKAEINKLNFYSHSGHAYPELVEKTEGRVVAEMRSIIWKADFERIQNKFISQIKEPLKDGIKVLLEAKITYSPAYGLSLTILDIDPMLTLGDLEREKMESINELKKLGIYDQNKQLPLALIPQRIAVISVETSKGWSDFVDVIRNNKEGYDFAIQLFPAVLQGDKAPFEIREQLKKVAASADRFDAVAIIRGGGGDVGLSCYNHLELCKSIANFPIPVLTGIGHSTNETVSEMVSHTNAITPTKLAELLLQKFRNFEQPMESMLQRFHHLTLQKLKESDHQLDSSSRLFRNTMQLQIQNKDFSLQQLQQKASILALGKIQELDFAIAQQVAHLKNVSQNQWQKAQQQLELLDQKTQILSPVHVLKRGYSITRLNGKSVTTIEQVKDGDVIKTEVLNGIISSKIENN
jgi:exodeoxyribonuclease VII large subunit